MMEKRDIASLMDDLTCDDIIRCQKARRSLVTMGHTAVPSLIEALGSSKNWIRWEAAKALSQIGDPTATDVLIKTLEDKNFDLRWLAAEGLIAIGKKSVVPLLRALIGNPKSLWLREGAHHVLHDMDRGDWDEELKPVMDALESFEPSVEIPMAAKQALDALTSQRIS
jgi:HEAT repeat protein